MDAKTKAKYKAKCRDTIKILQANSSRLTADFTKVDKIFTYYDEYRKHIHNNMECKDIHTNADQLMDNHKIAAALFCSFLKARPLSYVSDNSNVPPNKLEIWSNEQGAFLFGLQIVQDFWADKLTERISDLDKEIYKNLIHIPETDDDNYIHWFIKLVIDGVEKYFDYENKKYEEKLIFFIAHIYFMIDSYSYQYHRSKFFERCTEYLSRKVTNSKKTTKKT